MSATSTKLSPHVLVKKSFWKKYLKNVRKLKMYNALIRFINSCLQSNYDLIFISLITRAVLVVQRRQLPLLHDALSFFKVQLILLLSCSIKFYSLQTIWLPKHIFRRITVVFSVEGKSNHIQQNNNKFYLITLINRIVNLILYSSSQIQ